MRCLCGGWIDLDDSVDLRKFQDALDHPFHSAQAQAPTQLLEFAQAPNESPDGGTINEGHAGKVEDSPKLVHANHLLDGLFDLPAVPSNADAACHLEEDDARLNLLFGKYHEPLRLIS